MNSTVFSIPGSLTSNPYLSLLYTAVEHAESPSKDTFQVEPFSTKKLIENLLHHDSTIIHIHWETTIYGSRFWLYSLVKMLVRFPLLFIARTFGARIVWTMHNISAHNLSTTDTISIAIDSLGRSIMRRLAQKIIIQNKTYAAAFTQRYHLPSTKVIYIPHGNYIDAYGPLRVDVAKAREELSIPNNAIVLLALGAIRPYKNVEKLIEAVHEAVSVHLVIAGKGEPAYIQKVQLKAKDLSCIQIIPHFVADSEIPTYFAAADYALFAHGNSSLTSGALLLALSYGTPVITLPMPAAESIEDGKNGYVVENTSALIELFHKLPLMQKLDPYLVQETVAKYTREKVGAETREVYRSLFLDPKHTY